MLKLGRIFGIDVSLHWSLLLLIAFAGFNTGTAALTAAVFGCVLLHELGHSLAARQFGIETHSIVLLPIGGIASLESMPRDPFQELWIAVAGPLVNVVIAAGLALLAGPIASVAPSLSGFLQYLMFANIVLVCFNMLPAFPMDGGRVLRAVLAMQLSYVNATQIAAWVGKLMAFVLAGVGIYFGQFMLMFVAAFVYFAGSAEARAVIAEQVGRDWRATLGEKLKNVDGYARFRSRTGLVGKLDVVWDDVSRKYYYAASH